MLKNKKRTTIKDVLKEYELAGLGLKVSVDGISIDTFGKTMEFYEDSGMRETPEYKAIQEKYRGKILTKDKTLALQFQKEIVDFKIKYFDDAVDEYKKSLSK